MKPRNGFEKAVVASNEKLTTISYKAEEWAIKNVAKHIAFRTSGHKCTCGDCGEKFEHKGKGNVTIRCPHCGHKVEIADTLRRKWQEANYFSTLEAIDGLQVQRVFLLKVIYHKGTPIKTDCMEVCRMWLNAQGKVAVTARKRAMGYYVDSFNWASSIELRNLYDVYWCISDTYIYSRHSLIPELRRNGLKGKLPDCHLCRLMPALLTDHRIETLMKSGNRRAVAYFVNHPLDLDVCWASHKIAARHRYVPKDYGMWCDLIRLLDKCGRDIRSVKYICPKDLKVEHDRWLHKVNAIEKRRKDMEQMQKAKKHEADFYKEKACFFGIVISDDDIEISVLDSLEAYKAEGERMKHCVFQCEYYAKTDSVILSAHDLQGNRIETVEFSLSQGKVIQSRGVCNQNTEYHDRIVKLVNENAHRFIEARRTSA